MNTLRFLIDENLPPEFAMLARKRGYHADSVQEIYPGKTDDEILKDLIKTGAVLVTKDVAFANIILFQMSKIPTLSGVVLIPEKGSIETIEIWNRYLSSPFLRKSLVVLTKKTIRIRPVE